MQTIILGRNMDSQLQSVYRPQATCLWIRRGRICSLLRMCKIWKLHIGSIFLLLPFLTFENKL